MDKIDACPSSSSPSLAPQTDEFSLFLQQILVRSSSSSSSLVGLFGSGYDASPENLSRLFRTEPVVCGGAISAVDSAVSGCLLASTGGSVAGNASSSSVGVGVGVGLSENENDDYDCESEGGLEALIESTKTNTIPRGSSKRSRSAEVHNLSEKRRRSRINEKMKALQNLIPNSNKTDKASMLDEAIEYLKQLQLQVQMLAMRNGLSLHPVSLPRELQPAQLSQMRMDFGALHPNVLGPFPLNQEAAATQNLFAPPSHCTSSNQQLLPNMLNIINSDASLGLEPPIHPHVGVFQLPTSAQDICKENEMRNQQTNANHPESSPLEFQTETAATLGSFDRQSSNMKGNDPLETCIGEGEWSENVLLKAIEQSLIHSTRTGRSASMDDLKIEGANL